MTRRPQRPTDGRRKGGKRRGAKTAAARAEEPVSKSKTLASQLQPKQSPEAANAEFMVEGVGMNAATAAGYSKGLGDLDLTECIAALVTETRRVQGGNLAGLEATLAAQAVTLNAMFTQLAYQASTMTIVDQIDRFTRLALKAQGQCRTTVETLAAIKNPPVVFARQANIAHGPQQVNNAVAPASRELQQSSSRAGNQETEQIKLLEAHGERLDVGAAGTARERDQELAPVGTLNRPANG